MSAVCSEHCRVVVDLARIVPRNPSKTDFVTLRVRVTIASFCGRLQSWLEVMHSRDPMYTFPAECFVLFCPP